MSDPLPPRFDLDFNPVPRPAPGAGSFGELESLALKWLTARPDTLICHPSVARYIVLTAPAPQYPAREYKALLGLRLEVDATLPLGGWKLQRGDEVLDSGTAVTA